MNIDDSYGVYIVTEGSGRVVGEGYERKIKKGDYFFLPCCAMGAFKLTGNLECVECYWFMSMDEMVLTWIFH